MKRTRATMNSQRVAGLIHLPPAPGQHLLRHDEVGVHGFRHPSRWHRDVEPAPHPRVPATVHVLAKQAVHGARATAFAALRVLLVREHGMSLEKLHGRLHWMFLACIRTDDACISLVNGDAPPRRGTVVDTPALSGEVGKAILADLLH